MTIENFHEGDKRCETLFAAIKEQIYNRGNKLPVPSILGVLELLKKDVIDNYDNYESS